MNEAVIQDKERGAGILARIPAGRWGNLDDSKDRWCFSPVQLVSTSQGRFLPWAESGWEGSSGEVMEKSAQIL
jgi:2-deoxy-D-gluconate 3-dehydrogenase